jgi:multidrug efflux pump subunit AcrB
MLTLAGVVVNDSLLIVNRFNDFREQNLTLIDAATEACLSRFRAIILTSVTTFAGLYPLLTETSEQAQYLIPVAASMAYGLLFATVISLLLIPVLLVICAEIGA